MKNGMTPRDQFGRIFGLVSEQSTFRFEMIEPHPSFSFYEIDSSFIGCVTRILNILNQETGHRKLTHVDRWYNDGLIIQTDEISMYLSDGPSKTITMKILRANGNSLAVIIDYQFMDQDILDAVDDLGAMSSRFTSTRSILMTIKNTYHTSRGISDVIVCKSGDTRFNFFVALWVMPKVVENFYLRFERAHTVWARDEIEHYIPIGEFSVDRLFSEVLDHV